MDSTKCPVYVDGKPCRRELVKQEIEDHKQGPIRIYVCEQGHRPFFSPLETPGSKLIASCGDD